jgi:hypothetical protein
VKHLIGLSAFSLVSSLALADSTPAATPAATTAPTATATPSAAPVAKTDSSTKVGMRAHLDPFYKNINDAAKNYKIPKLETFRLMFEREFGKYSKADIEVRIHELESRENSQKKPWYVTNNDDNKSIVNTGTLKYFHLLFKVPQVDGLELGYVREMEPGLHGYTDKPKSSNVVETPSFTGHMGRVEGYRAQYKIDDKSKVTYHVARTADQNDYTLGQKPSDTTWYHKLSGNAQVADNTSVEVGIGVQGKWLALTDSSKLKYDNFLHVVAESKLDDLKLKYGFAYDAYATTKLSDGSKAAANKTATTALVGAKYDVLPKEFTLIGELGWRSLKMPSDAFKDFTAENTPLVSSASEASLVIAGQYFLDEKLSFIPSYNFFNSNRAQSNTGNTIGEALADRKILVSGADRKAAKSEHALGMRIRYDY